MMQLTAKEPMAFWLRFLKHLKSHFLFVMSELLPYFALASKTSGALNPFLL